MEKYNELHLFIDESGTFTEDVGDFKRNDIRLVGGVLLFGPYADTVESGLKNAMVAACSSVGIGFPLHFKDLREISKVKPFAQNLSHNLADWRKRTETPIYGTLIQHKEDVFYDSADILSEQAFDNRYVSMLLSLVEYLCFASDKVNCRLTDDANIHLHIATRRFPLPKDDDVKNLYESLGYKIVVDKKNADHYFVNATLYKSDIATMFRVALRTRWRHSNRSLGSVDIETLHYNHASAPAAMYLADIILGVERKRLQNYGASTQSVVPILENLEYGRTLESTIRCKSYIAEDNTEALLGSLANAPFDSDDSHNQDIVHKLISLFKQDKEPFYQLYETVLQDVNHPHYREKGLKLQTLLDTVHEKSGINDLRMNLHTLKIDMAHHNHTGNITAGNADWEQYLQLEPQLAALGEKAMEFYTDFRCKRAVNLMDEFRYQEAGDVLIDAGQTEEDFAKTAVLFGGSPDDFPKERRGWVYSSLGQVLAFQGKKEQAEEMFRNALRCFEKKSDIEREWVYLGHLACDFPESSQTLINEVFQHLPQNTNPFEEPFILALKLKTTSIFGDTEQQKQWANDILTFVKSNDTTLPSGHPWGLIYQMTAMLLRKTGDANHAELMFNKALWSFGKGEGILQELGKYCKERKNGKPVPEKIRFNYW